MKAMKAMKTMKGKPAAKVMKAVTTIMKTMKGKPAAKVETMKAMKTMNNVKGKPAATVDTMKAMKGQTKPSWVTNPFGVTIRYVSGLSVFVRAIPGGENAAVWTIRHFISPKPPYLLKHPSVYNLYRATFHKNGTMLDTKKSFKQNGIKNNDILNVVWLF